MKKVSTKTVAALFFGARKANLLRHAMKGTLPTHLARKMWIKTVLKMFPFPK